jgi:hypothetical protein
VRFAAAGEDFDRGIPEMDLHPVAVELDLVNPAFARAHAVANSGSMIPGMAP